MKTTKSLIGAFALLCMSQAHAQESINCSGGDATGTGGSVSYSIGQTAYLAINENSYEITEGVQQPYEIYVVGISETADLNLDLSAFPNPTSDALTLSVGNYEQQPLNYTISDTQGKILQRNAISSQTTQLSIADQPAGIYYLTIEGESIRSQAFKIIKH